MAESAAYKMPHDTAMGMYHCLAPKPTETQIVMTHKDGRRYAGFSSISHAEFVASRLGFAPRDFEITEVEGE